MVNAPANPVLVSNVSLTNAAEMPQAVPAQAAPAAQGAGATVTINASQPGADIEVDGAFVGSAPTTIQLTAGTHKIKVGQGAGTWERDLQITGGTVNINAVLGRPTVQRAAR